MCPVFRVKYDIQIVSRIVIITIKRTILATLCIYTVYYQPAYYHYFYHGLRWIIISACPDRRYRIYYVYSRRPTSARAAVFPLLFVFL